jgi:hypothetical protein
LKTRNVIRIVTGAAGAAVLACAAFSCSDQPRVRCAAARGNFAATYRLVSGTGACAGLKGDVLAVQTYNGSNADKTPNWDQASMGIQPTAITGLLQAAGGAMVSDPNPEDLPYSLGNFSTPEPGSDDFCVVPTLSATRLRLPEIPAGMDGMGAMTPGQPATDVKYTWSNVRVYVTAAANGTEFSASLTVEQDGCTAEYAVEGLYPAVSCLVPPPMEPPPEMPSDDAGATDEASVAVDDAGSDSSANDDAATVPDEAAAPDVEMPPAPMLDETLCSPLADPANGRPLGSGINPDVATRCDPDLQLCVLAKAPPALK